MEEVEGAEPEAENAGIRPYGSPIGYPNARYLGDLLSGPVDIQEKVDGSQFSFQLNEDGEPEFKSREQMIDVTDLERVNNMFRAAILNIIAHKDRLVPGWVYRGESLRAVRHNKLSYGRIPQGNCVLFDVETPEGMIPACDLDTVAALLGMEAAKLFTCQSVLDHSGLLAIFERAKREGSALGGPLEGVVVKNYARKNPKTGKGCLSGKIVTAEFQESMNKPAKEPKDVVYAISPSILGAIPKEPVWDKAVQHLKENGKLTGEMKDIPVVLEEISKDFEKTSREAVGDALYEFHRKEILKYMASGFAPYYKEKLGE